MLFLFSLLLLILVFFLLHDMRLVLCGETLNPLRAQEKHLAQRRSELDLGGARHDVLPELLDDRAMHLSCHGHLHEDLASGKPQLRPGVMHVDRPLFADGLFHGCDDDLSHDLGVVRLGAVVDVPDADEGDLLLHPRCVARVGHERADHLEKLDREHGLGLVEYDDQRRRDLCQGVEQQLSELGARAVVHGDVPGAREDGGLRRRLLKGEGEDLAQPGPQPVPRPALLQSELAVHNLSDGLQKGAPEVWQLLLLDPALHVQRAERLELLVQRLGRVDHRHDVVDDLAHLASEDLLGRREHRRCVDLRPELFQKVVAELRADLCEGVTLEHETPRLLDLRDVGVGLEGGEPDGLLLAAAGWALARRVFGALVLGRAALRGRVLGRSLPAASAVAALSFAAPTSAVIRLCTLGILFVCFRRSHPEFQRVLARTRDSASHRALQTFGASCRPVGEV
mmetsp:Transcript_33727/g.82900  ORF Transcript_33727/g.82900 Transcript_33727/m.82900 type:complete len:453 (+) Transcript_33727:1440-2798(+)